MSGYGGRGRRGFGQNSSRSFNSDEPRVNKLKHLPPTPAGTYEIPAIDWDAKVFKFAT